MAGRNELSVHIQEQVRQRANYLCEYCHASERWQYVSFTVDHVIPLSLGGSDRFENLALACFHCNRQKTNRVRVLTASGDEVALFNPRKDAWNDHFVWSADGLEILALTLLGDATIVALGLNRDRVIGIRAADKEIGRHPPHEDSVRPNRI